MHENICKITRWDILEVIDINANHRGDIWNVGLSKVYIYIPPS